MCWEFQSRQISLFVHHRHGKVILLEVQSVPAPVSTTILV